MAVITDRKFGGIFFNFQIFQKVVNCGFQIHIYILRQSIPKVNDSL